MEQDHGLGCLLRSREDATITWGEAVWRKAVRGSISQEVATR